MRLNDDDRKTIDRIVADDYTGTTPFGQIQNKAQYTASLKHSEDTDMAENLQEFVRQSIDKLLESLPAEELRKRLSPEERLEGLPAEERLKGLSAEEVVGALSPEVLEALARQLKANGPSAKPQ